MENITIEAPSAAAAINAVTALPHETRATITLTEQGTVWAAINVSPMTDSMRASFPLLPTPSGGIVLDTKKRGQSGVTYRANDARHPLSIVIERARKIAKTYAQNT